MNSVFSSPPYEPTESGRPVAVLTYGSSPQTTAERAGAVGVVRNDRGVQAKDRVIGDAHGVLFIDRGDNRGDGARNI